jgi:hypothetical protein
MTRRIVCLALALASAGVLAVPAGAERSDLWSGRWKYSADGGQTYGILRLDLKDDAVHISGFYDSVTSGHLGGKLEERFGKVFCGTFKDTHGQNRNSGSFCVTLQDTESWKGWYKPCKVFCYRQKWFGDRL